MRTCLNYPFSTTTPPIFKELRGGLLKTLPDFAEKHYFHEDTEVRRHSFNLSAATSPFKDELEFHREKLITTRFPQFLPPPAQHSLQAAGPGHLPVGCPVLLGRDLQEIADSLLPGGHRPHTHPVQPHGAPVTCGDRDVTAGKGGGGERGEKRGIKGRREGGRTERGGGGGRKREGRRELKKERTQ